MAHTVVNMSNTNRVEALATKILQVVKDDDRDLAWLSEKSGIPYSTLRSKLIYKPSRLSAGDLFPIASALGMTAAVLVAIVEHDETTRELVTT